MITETPSGEWTSGLDSEERETLMSIANDTLDDCVSESPAIWDPSRYPLTSSLKDLRATFVTIRIDGALRGCVGNLKAREALYLSVHANAESAACRDSRFHPLSADERPLIHVDISILSPPRLVKSVDEIMLGRDGIILERGHNRAVFLPEVAPGMGWSLEQTLSALSRKAGLQEQDWRLPDATFSTFSTVVLEEPA